MDKNKMVTLEDVLGRDAEEFKALQLGEFSVRRLGLVPYTQLEQKEYKQAKRDAMVKGKDGLELDDDKLQIKVIIAAVDKDTRSTFTFANKQLLDKLGVATADHAVEKLLDPGEIYKLAVAIQDASGWGAKAEVERTEAVKN